MLGSAKDINLVFLRSQVLLAAKKPKEAFCNLASHFEPSLVTNTGYLKFILKSAIAYSIPLQPTMVSVVDATLQKAQSVNSNIVIMLADYLD